MSLAVHVDDGTRVPYPRWRRWVASLRRRALVLRAAEAGGDPHDRVYLGYGVVLLALVYGPILWSALAQAVGAAPVPDAAPGRAAAVTAGTVLALGVACLAGLAAARAGGPLWASPAEAAFALSGQFRPRDVLRRRALLLTLGAGVVGAFVATAAAAGLAGGPAAAEPSALVAAGAAAALLAQVPLAVGAAAQAPGRGRAAVAVTGLLLALGAAAAVGATRPGAWDGLDPGWWSSTGAVVVAGGVLVVVAGLASACLVARVLPDELDVDTTAAGRARTVTAGRGLVGGDSGATADVLGPRAYRGRRAGLPAGLSRRAPLAARDLLGLRRRPAAAVGALVAGCAGALLVRLGAEGGPALVTVAGALALYGAARTWADGLHTFAAQPQPGALLPGTTTSAVAGHGVVPAAAGVLAVVVGAAGASWPVVAATAGLVALVLGVRVWVAGATAAPPGLFTPMMTPNGDMSMLVLGAWYLRGWLVVAAAAWVLQRTGPGVVPAIALGALAAALAAAGVRRCARA